VEGELAHAARLGIEHELALLDQFGDELRMVEDLVVAAHLWVLVLEYMQTVRAGRDDLLYFLAFMVSMFCCASIWYSISLPVRRAASPQQVSSMPSTAKLNPRLAQNVHQSQSVLLHPVVVGARAAHPQQPFGIRLLVERGTLWPSAQSCAGRRPGPRVAVLLQVLEGAHQIAGYLFLQQHQIAPHLQDLAWVVDDTRAHLQASAAGGTRPQHLFAGTAADQIARLARFFSGGVAMLEAFDEIVKRPTIRQARLHVVAQIVHTCMGESGLPVRLAGQ